MAAHGESATKIAFRIGVLFVLAASDPENQARLAIFIQGLRDRGWTEGHNIQFDVRYGDDHAQNIRLLAKS